MRSCDHPWGKPGLFAKDQVRCDASLLALRDQLRSFHTATSQPQFTALYGAAHSNVALAHHSLGRILIQKGDVAAARRHHERGLEMREATLDATHPMVAKSLLQLATVLRMQGAAERAAAALHRAVRIMRACASAGRCS